LQAVGIAGNRPLPDLAQTPLLGGPPLDMRFDNWQGIFAPASLGLAQAELINKLFNDTLRSPDVRAAIYADGATPAGGTSADLKLLMRNDAAKYGGVVVQAGVTKE
jgi:tripartite-type tricarboxylate transporter receptor subunit TctC